MTLYGLLRPALFLLPPESAHTLALRALRLGLVGGAAGPDDPVLGVEALGLTFANPVGLAAGFDKDAEVVGPVLRLGFGFVEAGTVTPRPQPGNPKPRLFRLTPDRAVINRLGFNGGGLRRYVANLRRFRAGGVAGGIVGANIGKNRDTEDAASDYEAAIPEVAPLADYIVLNISSPNTPGLRALQDRPALEALLDRVDAALDRAGARPPVLVKIAPDLTAEDRRDIADIALAREIGGLIIGNTTIARPETLKSPHRSETGGLSGRPLFAPSTALLAEMYRLTGGRVTLIGCGGIASGADAYAKIRAGATLVQLYTAMVYDGPGIAARIKTDLAAALRRDGFASVAEAVGVDAGGPR